MPKNDDIVAASAVHGAWNGQRRAYRALLKVKSSANSFGIPPWINNLPGRGRLPVSGGIGVDAFQQFFKDKVTANAPPPSFSAVDPNISLSAFQPVGIKDIIDAICRLLNKHCTVSVLHAVVDDCSVSHLRLDMIQSR